MSCLTCIYLSVITEKTRLLAARGVYEEITNTLTTNTSGLSKRDQETIQNRLAEIDGVVQQMLQRAAEADDTIASWDHSVDSNSGWTLGSELLGIQTHYKLEEDGLLMVRMEALSDDLPIFEQLAVINEVDLFSEWMPFCSKSTLVAKMGRTEVAAYLKISAPFMSRDTTLRAYGQDALNEHGVIIIHGKSVDYVEGCELPFEGKSWFHDRLEILDFKSLIEVTEPTKAKMTIIMKVDLRCPLPQPIVNFFVRNLAGMILHSLQKQATKIISDPFSKHGQRIRDDKEFYTEWLLKKLQQFCAFKNWDVPEIVCLKGESLPVANIDGSSDDSSVSTCFQFSSLLCCLEMDDEKLSTASCENVSNTNIPGASSSSSSASSSSFLSPSFDGTTLDQRRNNFDNGVHNSENHLYDRSKNSTSSFLTALTGSGAKETQISLKLFIICMLLQTFFFVIYIHLSGVKYENII